MTAYVFNVWVSLSFGFLSATLILLLSGMLILVSFLVELFGDGRLYAGRNTELQLGRNWVWWGGYGGAFSH